MSGESLAHALLVEKLIQRVRDQHARRRDLVLFADHRSFGINRPHCVNGYFPDVYASDVPITFRVIGEAKTAADLTTPRTAVQLSAFCRHLGLYTDSHIYLAVPWHCKARARCILRAAAGDACERINLQVLGF